MIQNLLETNSSLKLLSFQLSNVRELETFKYAFVNPPGAYWIICLTMDLDHNNS